MADTPNRLGRFLRYFTEAVRFASAGKSAGAGRRFASNPLLSNILADNSRQAGAESSNLDYFARLGVTNPFYFYALKVISDRVANVGQFAVEQKDDDAWKKMEGHEFLDRLAAPNSIMTGALLLGLIAEWMNTTGNAYLFLVTETPGVGPIQEIWPLPAWNVQPEPMTLRVSPFTGKPIIDYRYTLSSPVLLPGENIVHIRTPNLFDFWRGMAPLSALQAILSMDSAETAWLASYFGENNAVPTAIISVPPDLGEPEFDMVKRDILEQFGAQRRSAVTRAGDLKVETIQHTIQEMRVLEGMEFNQKAIYQVLRVPVGLADSSSGQSRLAADMALMRDAIQPMLNNIAAWLTLKAMPFYGDNLRCVAENVIPQDAAVETVEYAAYSPDRTLQENREKLKLPPLKLSGELAQYQPLFDEVPQRWFELFFSVVQAKNAPQPAPGAAGLLGVSGENGQSAEISPQKRGEDGAQGAGNGGPGGVEMGQRMSGQQTREGLLADLLGNAGAKALLAALPDREQEGAQAWLTAQALNGLDETEQGPAFGVAEMREVIPAAPHRARKSFAYKTAGDYRAVLGSDRQTVEAVYRTRSDGATQRWHGERRKWLASDAPAGCVVVDADVVRRFIANGAKGE